MNEKMERGQDTVDQRLAAKLTITLGAVAEQANYLDEQVVRIRRTDDEANDALEGVLVRQFAVEAQVAERLEQIIQALAAGDLYIVKGGTVVRAVADRLALTWNTAMGAAEQPEDRNVTGEGYIGIAQDLLSNLKAAGVIR